MGSPTSWQNTDSARLRLHQYLNKLFASELFAGSARREKLLRYLVERTLAGEGSQVNEDSIGLDVFNKLPSLLKP
jgi:hypothetical protein